MSQKVKYFNLWTQLNKENIFANVDSFNCISCKYAKEYKEYTSLYKEMTQKLKISFTKCHNLQTKYNNVTYSHCPYFKQISKA